MSGPNQRQRLCALLVTYRLNSAASVEDTFCRGRIYYKLSKEPGFKTVHWGRWNEDESSIDILIICKDNVDTEKILHHLSPFESYLQPNCAPRLSKLDSPLTRLYLPTQGGAHVSITSFRIPASIYAADLAIRESVAEVFQALALGDPRHGSNYIPPPEEEIPLNHRIGTATGSWDSAWVDSCGEKEATLADKDWIACIRWERPQFETPFKARKNRHFNIRLGKLNGIRGIDVQGSSGDQEAREESEPLLASKGFWKPITETWSAEFEEHHVVFHEVDEHSIEADNSYSWSSCLVQ